MKEIANKLVKFITRGNSVWVVICYILYLAIIGVILEVFGSVSISSNLLESAGILLIVWGGLCLIIGYQQLLEWKKKVLLKRAISNGEFKAYLQPIMGQDGKHISGCEVLTRWQHPKKGIINPDYFIPLIEKNGMIVLMTRMLMQQVQQSFGPSARSLPIGFHFGFNIAASHCRDLSLVEDCRAFMECFEGQQIQLVLELTEREFLEPNAITRQLFAELKSIGVNIAIDDFGTGYSNLSYLQQFDIDYIKIDKCFVKKINSDVLSRSIVGNVLDLAKRLDLSIIVEGVEDSVQRDYFSEQNVDFMQGYFFGKPVPVADFKRQMMLYVYDV